MSKTYIVDGMSCGGCVKSVTNAIQDAIPGTTVSIDLESKQVTVDGPADDAKVEQAVEDAGFTYNGAA